jgi:hypothetical protein
MAAVAMAASSGHLILDRLDLTLVAYSRVMPHFVGTYRLQPEFTSFELSTSPVVLDPTRMLEQAIDFQ